MSNVYSFVGNEPSPLEHLTKLKQDRSLSDADLDRLGITLIAPSQIKDELGWSEANALIKIPYWGITGEKLPDNRGNQLARYRRTVANDKGERYTQRKGTGARHYLPRGQDWLDVSKDVDVPIFYTEGEFKAIAGCKHLGPTVANAGVAAWRGPNGLGAPLDEFVWKGRRVYICYDAESTCTASVPLKGAVAKCLGELAVELMVRGATVQQLLIARTSFFKEGTKLGLDDYFQVGGTKEALLATACDPQIDTDLARMFERYAVFVGTRPHILDIRDGRTFSAKEFADYIETNTRLKDGKPVKLANLYREHPDRNVVEQYVFDPSIPNGYYAEEKKFNTWQGFAIQPKRSENYDSNVGRYLAFQTGVWGDRYVGYFLDWASHLFQRPQELTTISPILVSRVKGVGKSLTGGFLRDLIGTKGSFVGSVDGLTEKHTGELEGKIFVQVDEADALFDGKENRLKALDSDEIRIRKMNTDGYTVRNILRKFYTTNENAAFRIASDERRYFVVRVDKGEDDGLESSPWRHFLRDQIVPLRRDRSALADIMEFFISRDISGWDPGAPVPRTDAMLDMVEAGESKKHTISNELYAELEQLGVWVTDSSISAVDKKMWGEIRAILKDKRGRTAVHIIKESGKARSVLVWMTRDRMLELKEDPTRGTTLVSGQLGGEQVRELLMKTRAAMEKTMRLVDSSKF